MIGDNTTKQGSIRNSALACKQMNVQHSQKKRNRLHSRKNKEHILYFAEYFSKKVYHFTTTLLNH